MTYLEELEQRLWNTKKGRLLARYGNANKALLLQGSKQTKEAVLLWGGFGRGGENLDQFYYHDFTSGEDFADIFKRAKDLDCPIDVEKDIPLEDWKEVEKV